MCEKNPSCDDIVVTYYGDKYLFENNAYEGYIKT